MDDLYILLILVIVTSIALYFAKFSLWWVVLILGLIIYFILTLTVTRSVQLSNAQLDTLKEEISNYFMDKIKIKRKSG